MSDYWAKRAQSDMERVHRQADRRLRVIGRAMTEAQDYLAAEVKKIFKRYRDRFGLTEDQARAELEKPVTRAEYDGLLERAASLPGGQERRQIEARLNSEAYSYRISRMEALRENIAIETARISQVIEDELTGQLKFTAAEAYSRRLYAIQKQSGDLFAVPDIQTFSLSVQSPWFGGDYSANIWKKRDALAEVLEQKITAGYLSGRSHRKIAQDIQDQFGVEYWMAERLVRTETSFLSNQADLAAYKRAGIKWYRWLAALDDRTCEECGGLDGQVFEVAKAQVGINFPPLHPNDRCTTISARDKDAPMTGQRRGRDADGKNMLFPADMTYEEWKRWQEEQVGKAQFAAAQKMKQRKASDQGQYDAYRKVIGKNEFTASFETFQQTKYLNPEAYGFLKLDYKRQNALLADPSAGLPNATVVTAAPEKFTQYLFNQENPSGWAKGVAFESRLGYNIDNWQEFRKVLRKAATRYPSTAQGSTNYGTRYEQKVVLYGYKGKPANVVIGWYADEGKTWLTTVMIKEVD